MQAIIGPIGHGHIAGAPVTHSLNDADNSVAAVFTCPKDGTIDRIGINVTVLGGNPPAYNVGIVTVNAATGNPDAAAAGGSVIESYDFPAIGQHWIVLATPAVVTAGQVVAARIWPGVTAPTGVNYVTIRRYISQNGQRRSPEAMSFTAAWAHNAVLPCIGVRYDDGEYIIPTTIQGSEQINSGTAVDEIAGLFTLVMPITCIGAKVAVTPNAAAGDFRVILYDVASNVLRSMDVDVSLIASAGTLKQFVVSWLPIDLQANTFYRLAVLPTTANNVQVSAVEVTEVAARSYFPEGARWQYSARADAGAWAQTDTKIPHFGLIAESISFVGLWQDLIPWGPGTHRKWYVNSSTPNFVNLNNAGNIVGTVFIAPKTGVINRVGFNCKLIVGDPPPYYIGLVTVDASGNPTAAPAGGSALEFVDYAGPGFVWVTLATPGNVVVGGLYAVRVWANALDLPDALNYARITYDLDDYQSTWDHWHRVNIAAAWSTAVSVGHAACYNDGEVVGVPLSDNVAIFNSGTGPDEVGALFQLPTAGTCVGVEFMYFPTGLGADFTVRLYNAAGAVLGSQVVDNSQFAVNAQPVLFTARWAPVDLAGGTNYRVAVEATTLTTLNIEYSILPAAADKDYQPEGPSFQGTERTDAGGWTNRPTYLPGMKLLLSELVGADLPDSPALMPPADPAYNPDLMSPPQGLSALAYASFYGPHVRDISLGDRKKWLKYVRR